jgi:hypothetical protein
MDLAEGSENNPVCERQVPMRFSRRLAGGSFRTVEEGAELPIRLAYIPEEERKRPGNFHRHYTLTLYIEAEQRIVAHRPRTHTVLSTSALMAKGPYIGCDGRNLRGGQLGPSHRRHWCAVLLRLGDTHCDGVRDRSQTAVAP